MKLLFILFFTYLACAQDVTVIAVGEADLSREKIYFNVPSDLPSFPTSDDRKRVKEIFEVITNDFKFYSHKYETLESSEGAEIIISIKLRLEGERYLVSITEKNGKFPSNESQFLFNRGRSEAHRLANIIYHSLNGIDSIFEKKIIFVSDRTSKGRRDVRKELYQMDFDGENKRRLTYKNSIIVSPAVSPDNSKYLYSIIEAQNSIGTQGSVARIKNLNLYEYDVRSRKTTMISNKKGLNSGAIYDSSGENIYLTLTFQKNADIYRMNLKTSKLSRVTSHFSDDVDPSINKAGDLMTFLSGRPGKAMIYTLDPRGTEKSVKRIGFVGKFNAAPKFSYDGKEIVFSSWVDDKFDLFKLNSDGTNLVRLTKDFGSNEEASFSPDGEFILFTSQNVKSSKSIDQDVYLMNKEGDIVKKLTNNYGVISTPRFTH